MKRSIITLLLITITFSAHAAPIGVMSNSTQPTKTSRSVPPYATTPLDLSVERLPENYKGHNIFDILKQLTPPRGRGEFEKTEEYEARINRWEQLPIFGKVTPVDTLAFEILAQDAFSVRYDADKEEIIANVSFKSGKVGWLETHYHSKSLGAHVGVTRMGVKFHVASYIGTSAGLEINNATNKDIFFSKPYPRDEALRIKPFIRAFAIATLEHPYKIDESISSTASLDNPNEWLTRYRGLSANLKAIWLVNTKTGEIMEKFEAPFIKCRYGVWNDERQSCASAEDTQ